MHGLGIVFGGGVDGVEDLGWCCQILSLPLSKIDGVRKTDITNGVGPVLTN